MSKTSKRYAPDGQYEERSEEQQGSFFVIADRFDLGTEFFSYDEACQEVCNLITQGYRSPQIIPVPPKNGRRRGR
jgi:hypothetical protein